MSIRLRSDSIYFDGLKVKLSHCWVRPLHHRACSVVILEILQTSRGRNRIKLIESIPLEFICRSNWVLTPSINQLMACGSVCTFVRFHFVAFNLSPRFQLDSVASQTQLCEHVKLCCTLQIECRLFFVIVHFILFSSKCRTIGSMNVKYRQHHWEEKSNNPFKLRT